MIGKVKITSTGYDPDKGLVRDPTLEGWIPTDIPPDEGVEVLTMIDDEKGRRNEQSLKRQGRLWFAPDGSMYVYYQPSHWRPLP